MAPNHLLQIWSVLQDFDKFKKLLKTSYCREAYGDFV